MVVVVNVSKQSLLAGRVSRLNSPWGELASLLSHPEIYPGEGVVVEGELLRSVRSVGTRFLRFPIDVVFINADGRVVATAEGIKPFARLPIHPGACRLLKLPAGTIGATSTAIGDQIAVIDGDRIAGHDRIAGRGTETAEIA